MGFADSSSKLATLLYRKKMFLKKGLIEDVPPSLEEAKKLAGMMMMMMAGSQSATAPCSLSITNLTWMAESFLPKDEEGHLVTAPYQCMGALWKSSKLYDQVLSCSNETAPKCC